MFIARSAARIRRVRIAFVTLGILPCAVLVAWALHLRSTAHRDSLRRGWQQRLGVALEVGSVAHLRPGAVRAEGCVLLDATGQRVLELARVEAEAAAVEDRLTIDRLCCDEHGAGLLAALARDWLYGEARFPRSCVVDVADFRWDEAAPAAALRVECVAHAGSRAIRIVRHAAAVDEVRIVRTWSQDPGGAAADHVEIEASCSDAVPWKIVAALTGAGRTAATIFGPRAAAQGSVHAAWEGDSWSGTVAGRITAVDAASCAAALGSRAAGEATIGLDGVVWRRGRLSDGTIDWSVGPGWIDGRLLDRMAAAFGSPPRATVPTAGAQESFDAMACRLRIGPGGVQMQTAAGSPGGLVTARGMPLLEAPAAVVPFDRFAWMLAAPGTTYVPASGPGAWLMSVLPGADDEPARGGPQATNPPSQGGGGAF